ncbi:hypothetical protein ACEWPL_017395 [Roseovarius sp. S1116L3]|uniref:hypothetical protein n=1 Tax=Roseovarius roseus TaxID=3342636 RepID=UPI003729E5CE
MLLASWASNVLSEPDVAKPELVALATDAMKQEFGEDVWRSLFTRDEFARLKAHFSGLNVALAKRRKAVQPGFRISPAQADNLTLFRNGVTNGYWIRLARMLSKVAF